MNTTYDIIEEPEGYLYKTLIDYCIDHSQIVLLVLRETDWIEASVRSFLEQFSSILIAREQATEWPGTMLTSGTAAIFKYRITSDLVT